LSRDKRLGLEGYKAVLDHLKQCANAIVAKYGGTVVRAFRGDGFFAIFGLPDASEDDGRRATQAALELHEVIRQGAVPSAMRAAPRLTLHSGIHAGLVLLSEGEPFGEVPNLAKHLSDIAGPDEILVSATTLGAEKHFFQTEERSISFEGKPPVPTCRVIGRSAVTRRFEARTKGGLTPFVGRTSPLDRLEEHLGDAVTGRTRTVAIVAAPGLGKTRLAEEFFRRASVIGCDILRGYCESHFSAEPLQPFVQILRALGGDEKALPYAAPARGEDPTAAMCELIAGLTRQRPSILFIDDWQWVDEASRRVVAALRERTDLRLLILITSRDRTARDSVMHDADVIALAPLDEADAIEAIRALRPNANPFVVRQIQELAGGNPLFIEELCHEEPPDEGREAPIASEEAPAWLSTLIESRVARLSRQQFDFVRVAAIIGAVVPVWLLELILGGGEHGATLRALSEKDLVHPGKAPGTVRFKHGITRDVVYNSIGRADREGTHRRIAELIEQSADGSAQDELLETLAYHSRAGGDPVRAARYAERAGHKAMRASALDRARTQYGVALEALDQLPATDETYQRWMSIAQRLALACVYDPTREQVELFRRAVELASAHDDAIALTRAEYWLGYVMYALGEVSAAIAHFERARAVGLEAIRSARDGTLAAELGAFSVQVLATLGQAHSAAGEHHLAMSELGEAIEARRRHKNGGRLAVGSAYALACKGASLGDLGRFDEAHECFKEALEAVTGDHAVNGSVLNWQGGVYLWQGRWSDALAVSVEAARIAERIESLYVLGMARSITAYARWKTEGDPAAIDTLARVASWLEARDKRLVISFLYGWLADALADAGRFAEARRYVARALRRARSRDPFGESTAYRAMARLALRGGARRQPEHYLQRALEAAAARGAAHEIAVTVLEQAHLEGTRGRRAEAGSLLARARAAFAQMGMAWHLAKTEQLLISEV
jgi:tetratricopeptide (TPR) repeat protein